MPVHMEVVATLHAEGFMNSGRVASGKILKVLPNGPYRLQVEETVKNVPEPTGSFDSEEDARSALIDFWSECNRALTVSGTPSWQPKLRT